MGHFETPEQFFRSLNADVAGALIAAAEFANSVSLFQQESATHFMPRLSVLGLALQEPVASGKQMLLKVMESAPDAFVVTDLDGRIWTSTTLFSTWCNWPARRWCATNRLKNGWAAPAWT